MGIVLFDNYHRTKLYPLNSTCAVADLRVGIFTMRGRWQHNFNEDVYIKTADYLSLLYKPIPSGLHFWIEANLIPDKKITELIFSLKENEAIADDKGLIAGRKNFANEFSPSAALDSFNKILKVDKVRRIEYPWQIFQLNNEILREDFEILTAGKKSARLPSGNQCIGCENIFIEEGSVVNFSIINAETGPVYIGKNCTVMEGCFIRGPVALCDGTTLKMGAKIYGASTFGPFCVAGGEIKNVVMRGYSNKAHDGYLGDSVIGSWCNMGAGTTNSNMKNTASIVRVWSAFAKEYVPVDVKCGVIMGDYSRTSINSSINTGTVIGVCCNVFGEGFLPKYIPDFSWGTKETTKYELKKALQDVANWKKTKGEILSDDEAKVLEHIYPLTP